MGLGFLGFRVQGALRTITKRKILYNIVRLGNPAGTVYVLRRSIVRFFCGSGYLFYRKTGKVVALLGDALQKSRFRRMIFCFKRATGAERRAFFFDFVCLRRSSTNHLRFFLAFPVFTRWWRVRVAVAPGGFGSASAAN